MFVIYFAIDMYVVSVTYSYVKFDLNFVIIIGDRVEFDKNCFSARLLDYCGWFSCFQFETQSQQ